MEQKKIVKNDPTRNENFVTEEELQQVSSCVTAFISAV